MRLHNSTPYSDRARWNAVAVVAALALTLALAGCSDDDGPPPPLLPTATATTTSTPTVPPTNTATATAVPTVTPTMPAGHDEVLFGSSEDGGGEIDVEAPDEVADAGFSTCLGGEGEDCTGGLAIFTAGHPGFEPVAEVEHGLFPLADGTTVFLQITQIDSGMTIGHDGEQIDLPGESLLLGTLPVDDHFHVEFTMAIPGGDPLEVKSVSLLIRTNDDQYLPSQVFTLQFQPTHEEHEHE